MSEPEKDYAALLPAAPGLYHDVSPKTEGVGIVHDDINALRLQLYADDGRDKLAWSTERSHLQDPRVLGVGKRALIKAGVAEVPDGFLSPGEASQKEEIDRTFTTEKIAIAEKESASLAGQVRSDLEFTRIRLRELAADNPDHAEAIEESISESMSDYQRALLAKRREEEPGLTAIEWLTEKTAGSQDGVSNEDKHATDDDQRLLNFLQSHSYQIEQRQESRDYRRMIEKQKRLWKRGVLRGLAEGWLHERAGHRLPNVNEIRVYEGDLFSTAMSNRNGFAPSPRKQERYVVVAPHRLESSTVTHELNHAVLQYTPSEKTNVLRERWLIEPITEELAQTFRGALFGSFDLKMGSYRDERALLRDIIDFGRAYGADISLADFTRAYSAPEPEQIKLLQNINDRVYEAGGYGTRSFLSDINQAYHQQVAKLEKKAELEGRQPHRRSIETAAAVEASLALKKMAEKVRASQRAGV